MAMLNNQMVTAWYWVLGNVGHDPGVRGWWGCDLRLGCIGMFERCPPMTLMTLRLNAKTCGVVFSHIGCFWQGGYSAPHIVQIAILIWREHDEHVDIGVHPYFQTNSYKIRMFDPTFDDDPHWLCSNIVMGCSLQQPGREEKLRKVGDGSLVAVCFFPELLVGETEIPQEVLCGVLLFSKNDARSQSLYLRILVVFLTLPLWLLGALEFCLGCRDVL